MKKITTILAASFLAVAFCSVANAQISVGFGYANKSVNNKTVATGEDNSGYQKGTATNLKGFYVEGMYNWDFYNTESGVLSLQPGVRYYYMTSLRAKISLKNDQGETKSKSRFNDHLLDIPVNVKYTYDLASGSVKAYAFAGPVLSFGLRAAEKSQQIVKVDGETQDGSYKSVTNAYNGKTKTQTWTDGKWEKSESSSDGHMSLFDLKLGLGLGLQVMEKFDVKFGYNLGLLNRTTVKADEGEKYKAHSNILWFGVAYNF